MAEGVRRWWWWWFAPFLLQSFSSSFSSSTRFMANVRRCEGANHLPPPPSFPFANHRHHRQRHQ